MRTIIHMLKWIFFQRFIFIYLLSLFKIQDDAHGHTKIQFRVIHIKVEIKVN